MSVFVWVVILLGFCALVEIVRLLSATVGDWIRARYGQPGRYVSPTRRDQIPREIAAAYNASDYPIRIQARDVAAAMEEINAAILWAMADREKREKHTGA